LIKPRFERPEFWKPWMLGLELINKVVALKLDFMKEKDHFIKAQALFQR